MCGRVRLDNDYSEIKIRLKFAPDAPAAMEALILVAAIGGPTM